MDFRPKKNDFYHVMRYNYRIIQSFQISGIMTFIII